MKKLKFHYDYLIVIIIWLIIFGKNAFSSLLFVDYAGAVNSKFLGNMLFSSEFIRMINVLDISRMIFAYFGIWRIFFTFSILIAMLVSYFYIRKVIGNRIWRLMFALLYFFNPFVYSRIMIGQLGIVIAYLLIPAYFFYLFRMFDEDFEFQDILKVVIAFTIIGTLSPQFFVFNFLFFLVGSFWFYFYKNEFEVKRYLKILGIFVLLLIGLNAYWLQGFFSNPILNEFDLEHESFFAPKASIGISAVAKIMGMWGFWREAGYLTSYRILPIWSWYALTFILAVLMIIGYYLTADRKARFFYTLFWIGLILGVGASHPFIGKLFDALFNYLPLFNGFRDSHKFAALIALAYAYLIPAGVIGIARRAGRVWKVVLGICFVVLILVYTFPLIGLWGQAKNIEYPDSYYDADRFLLEQQKIEGHIIYLPWQSYLTYSWSRNSSSDGRISVPTSEVFSVHVIEGPDEWGGKSGLVQSIGRCLDSKEIKCLEREGVRYVLHDKCAYYEGYGWFNDNKVFESECIDIYELNGKAQDVRIPTRFIIGLLLSILVLLYVYFVLLKRRFRIRQA